MGFVGPAGDVRFAGADALCRAVTALGALRRRPVELHQHGIVDIVAKGFLDRMDDPSHSMARIWTRLARGSLFISIRYELSCLASSKLIHIIRSDPLAACLPLPHAPP